MWAQRVVGAAFKENASAEWTEAKKKESPSSFMV